MRRGPVAVAVALSVAACGSSSPHAADVDAARACQAFFSYELRAATAHAADPRPAMAAVTHLPPARAIMAREMRVVIADVQAGHLAAIRPAAYDVSRRCAALPASARTAGGYRFR